MTEICNLCNSEKFEVVKSKLRDDNSTFRVCRCITCNHIQLLPKPSEDDDRDFYNKNQQDKGREKEIDFEKLRRNNLYDTNRHIRLIKTLCDANNCSILDIGTGYGFFLNELYGHGYKNITGIEVSEERRALAQKHSYAKIINYDITKQGKEIGQYDVVTLYHVLEHMADPISFLKRIRNLIKQKGVLVCEVPNVKELLLETSMDYNDFYWIRAHVNYFSDTTLLDCFKKADYRNVEIRYEQRYGLINLCNWLTHGKPQIKNPTFTIVDPYEPAEDYYRQWLETQGRSDAMLAIVKNI